MGAFLEALDTLFFISNGKRQHLQYELFGKPHKVTYDYAKKVLIDQLRSSHAGHEDRDNVDDMTIYAIGDNPLSDIKGANGAGFVSMLLRTGVWQSSEENDSQNPATHVFPSVREAFKFICDKHL
ncbi:predicted protein [Naegleria gruberi]|nr:uncharacterized protein NAEGRDRAFT_76529 [Naegleria gruberi]EFC35808.1 predicted protein [Naegleria gruberi]|eukprot:XP_002668552.1 predicted protein [Naegleria gruberi strain NEG-M]